MLTKAVHCIFSYQGLHSRGWFRSIDLWVMGPARFRCATLPLCSSSLQSCCWLQGSHCRNISWKNMRARLFAVWCLFNCKLDLTKKKRLRRSRQSKGGTWLGMKLATCCPLKTSCRTSHPGFRLCFLKGNYTGVALKEGLAEDGFDPSTSGLWGHSALSHPRWDSNPQSLA